MSIASSVSTHELFGMDHQGLTFFQKTEMLDSMMEKLYVLSENNNYHLKVENDATPMSIVVQSRKVAPVNPFMNPDTNNFGDRRTSSGLVVPVLSPLE
jgi:hypothetical protein